MNDLYKNIVIFVKIEYIYINTYFVSITEDIQIVSSFIEENTRASETSGINYIDPRNFKNRILLNQNHVIFGRRGAGKSSLIRTLKENENKKYYFSYTNLEDLKDVSFPNILIHVLNNFRNDICDQINNGIKSYEIFKKRKINKLTKILNQAIDNLQSKIDSPDFFEEEIKATKDNKSSVSGKANTKSVEASFSLGEGNTVETAKKLNRNKLEQLKNSIPVLKEAIKQIQEYDSTKQIFLILDDFYFLKKDIQVFFSISFTGLQKIQNYLLR